MSTKMVDAYKSLERRLGPMTLGFFIRAFREADEISQTEYAKKLKISRANLCDIEKGRKFVGPARAARIAKQMDVPEALLIRLAFQDLLRAAHLKFVVEVREVS